MEQRLINYAKAAYELGITSEMLEEPREVIDGSAELKRLYADASVVRADKEEVTSDLARSCGWDKHVRNFLMFLSGTAYILRLADICDQMDRLRAKDEDVLDARLYCVHPPTDEQRDRLEKYLLDRFGGTSINLHIEVHTDLIGGFVIRVGDVTINRSMQRTAIQLGRVLKFK